MKFRTLLDEEILKNLGLEKVPRETKAFRMAPVTGSVSLLRPFNGSMSLLVIVNFVKL
jgi:hypothetical protein